MFKKVFLILSALIALLIINFYACDKGDSSSTILIQSDNSSSQNIPAQSGNLTTSNNSQQGSTITPPISNNNKVELVYFYPKTRCATCLYIETQVRYNVDTYFKNELSSGKLTMKSYNYTDNANAAIVKKFKITGSDLYINTIKDGADHIQVVLELWDTKLINDQPAFNEFVQKLIKKKLQEIA